MEENLVLRNGQEVIPAPVFCAVVPKLRYNTVMMTCGASNLVWYEFCLSLRVMWLVAVTCCSLTLEPVMEYGLSQ